MAGVKTLKKKKYYPAGSAGRTESSQRNLEDRKRFLDCFNRHGVEGILSCFAEKGVFETTVGENTVGGNSVGEGPAGRRATGKAAIGGYFAKMFANMPGTHFGEDTHWLSADGERGVPEGTPFGRTNPDGSNIHVRGGCDLFLMREGKIVLKGSYLKQIRRSALFADGNALLSLS